MTTIDPDTAARVRAELLARKDEALGATRRGDAAFYERYLADEALAILTVGVLEKAQVVAQLGARRPSFRSEAVTDVRAVALSPDCGVVTYRAEYERGAVLVGTTYVRRAGEWRGALYQQTPLP